MSRWVGLDLGLVRLLQVSVSLCVLAPPREPVGDAESVSVTLVTGTVEVLEKLERGCTARRDRLQKEKTKRAKQPRTSRSQIDV